MHSAAVMLLIAASVLTLTELLLTAISQHAHYATHMQALAEVCATSMPGLQSVIAAACAMLNDAAAPTGSGLSTATDLDPFETLADHVGLSLQGTDHSLSLALAGSVLDASLWDALPYAYAAAFAADHWKRCRYASSLDSFAGGEQSLVPAIMGLFRVLLPGKADVALRTYVDCAARTVLRMKQGRRLQYKEWCFAGMLVYLDKFVQGCSAVDRSALESLIPYSLVHAAYLELSRGSAA
jgi:Membrane-associated apoptosis protein